MRAIVTIDIWDCGCGVKVQVDGNGLRVINSGGCDVEKILGKVRIFSDNERTARAILAKWIKGYEGGMSAARENSLFVEVNGERVYA